MMQATAFLLILAPILAAAPFVFVPRLRMERRARALLAARPNAERKSVYLAFRAGWADGKRKELDAKIGEVERTGWTFLRATEASPLRTLRSWGGGLTLHFIRDYPDTSVEAHAV